MMILLATIVTSLAAFGLVALRFGAESRPGFDERPDGERFGVLR